MLDSFYHMTLKNPLGISCHIIDGRCTTLENFFLNNHLNQSDNLILSGQDADTTGCSLHTQISSLIFTSGILA